MRLLKRNIVLVLTTFILQSGIGQQKLQVITQTVTKNFSYNSGDKLVLEGEKADITIVGTNESSIEVILKLKSKALSREVAERELPQIRYVAEKRDKEVRLKNYFVLPKGRKKFEALLSASFEVRIPKTMDVEVTSRYGNLSVSTLSAQVNVDTKYSQGSLSNLNVEGSYTGYFGDLQVENITGDFKLDLKHVKTDLDGISGSLNIASNLGDIEIGAIDRLELLKVFGVKSDIVIKGVRKANYLYDLEAEFGKIYFDERGDLESDTNPWKYGNESQPRIVLKAKFGDINLIFE